MGIHQWLSSTALLGDVSHPKFGNVVSAGSGHQCGRGDCAYVFGFDGNVSWHSGRLHQWEHCRLCHDAMPGAVRRGGGRWFTDEFYLRVEAVAGCEHQPIDSNERKYLWRGFHLGFRLNIFAPRLDGFEQLDEYR